ncbi:hypothetical protein Tco_1158513 [Tanacetum coccineum]
MLMVESFVINCAKESWEIIEDLALYDNESWKDPRDLAKLVKAISLPQDVRSTSDQQLLKLEDQIKYLVLHPYSRSDIMKSGPNRVERVITEFMEFISAYQSISVVLIYLYHSLRV